jgi:hypothetical protein
LAQKSFSDLSWLRNSALNGANGISPAGEFVLNEEFIALEPRHQIGQRRLFASSVCLGCPLAAPISPEHRFRSRIWNAIYPTNDFD